MRWNQHKERRGVILLVVLALLTLFAIVGISFVLYADAEAASARVARESETQQRADVDPQQALAFFLGQLIYDVPDAPATAGSGLRGHSLARTMYGYNSTYSFPITNLNITPFNGVGRLHTGSTWPYMNPYSIDDHLLVNYTWFQGDGFARDPEWYGNRQTTPGSGQGTNTFYVGGNAPYTYPDLNNFFLAAVRSDGTVLTPSFHRPWLFGSLDKSNPNWSTPQGKYLTLRPRSISDHPDFPLPDDAYGDVKNLVGSPGGNDSIWIDLGAPVMTAPDGTLYKMLFAPLIMDLDNRIHVGAAGNIVGNNTTSLSNQGWFPSEMNLSTLWSNSPVTGGTTEWLKLFLGRQIQGAQGITTTYIGKYGPDIPNPIPTAPMYQVGYAAHAYAQIDSDGRNETPKGGNAATLPMQLPGTNANAPATTCFPYFPLGYGSNSTAERIAGGLNGAAISYRHPAAYAVYKPPLYTNTVYNSDFNPPAIPPQLPLNSVIPNSNNDLIFQPSDMDPLLRAISTGRLVDSGSSALISNLLRLCPQTLGSPASTDSTAFQRRNWITTISSDLARPALSPWIYNPATNPYTVSATTPTLPPSAANPVSFTTFAQRQAQGNNPLPTSSDFTSDWRAIAAALGRIDLNRSLPPYPHMSTSTTPMMTNTPNDRFDAASNTYSHGQIIAQFQTATAARQQLALDIYTCLLAVTGVAPPSNVAAPNATTDLAPRRWLAQLAVNIVDYIDADEISTPFNFYSPNLATITGLPPSPVSSTGYSNLQLMQTGSTPGTTNFTIPPAPTTINGYNAELPVYWVFGTELPRILINEVLGEYTLPANSDTFNVNVWVELFNPMASSAALNSAQSALTNNGSTLQPLDALPVPLWIPASGSVPAYNPYRVVIANNNTTPNAQGLFYDMSATPGLNNNVLGTAQYNYEVYPTTSATLAGCNFGNGNGELNAGYAGTVATPANPTATPPQGYPLFPSITGSWGLYGGLPTAQANPPSFILVGPSVPSINGQLAQPLTALNDVKGDIPGTAYYVPSPNMNYQVTNAGGNAWSVKVNGNQTPISITDNTTGVSVLLRRLANPHFPYNPIEYNPSTKAFRLLFPDSPPNPYVTVDYVSGVPLNGYGISTGGPTPPASCGKLQPYAANLTLAAANQVDTTSSQYVFQTKHHTLGGPNSTQANPYTWLVHLDRNLISPMELLHVSGFRPHELTQRFILGPNAGTNYPLNFQPYNYNPSGSNVPANANPTGYFQHYVPWFDQTRRLYRLFEFLEAYNGVSGVSPINGRVPGKININTLWDLPTPQQTPPYPAQNLMTLAIADPPANPNNPYFTALNVSTIFQRLLTLRTPNIATPALSQADRPFLDMAAGYSGADIQYSAAYGFPNGNGINHTLFTTAVPATQPNTQGHGPAFQLPNAVGNPQIAHPYLQNELLTKIYSRLTTRSNVFAVFLTVGFFQVEPGGAVNNPNIPRLGPEIGRSEGRQVRHRMFAIVDRSQLASFYTTVPATSTVKPVPIDPPQPWLLNPFTMTLNFNDPTGTTYQTVTGAPWSISPGSQLVIEPGTDNEETVTVTNVGGGGGNQITITANFLYQHPNLLFEGNPNVPPYVIMQRGNPGPWASYDPRKDPFVVPYYAIID